MAPTAPQTATEKRWARIRGEIPSHAPRKTHRENAATTDSFLSSKRDKQIIRRSAFLNKIQTTTPSSSLASSILSSSARKSSSSGIAKKKTKTRRPNKKLVATMEDLADALPDVKDLTNEEALGKVKHRSLKSRPGALKKKEKIVKGEMERFGESMARLVAGGGAKGGLGEGREGAAGEASSTGNRWKALRGYISSTMEQNPAFATKE